MAISHQVNLITVSRDSDNPADLSALRSLCESWVKECKVNLTLEPQYGEDISGSSISVSLNEEVSERAFQELSERVKAAFPNSRIHAEKTTGEMLDEGGMEKLLRGEKYEVRKRGTLN